MTIFAAFAPGFQVYPVFDRREHHLLFEFLPQLYPLWRLLLQTLAKISSSITAYFPVPIPIRLVVAFRREEWMSLVPQLTGEGRSGEAGRA